jgi:hypothetical protein
VEHWRQAIPMGLKKGLDPMCETGAIFNGGYVSLKQKSGGYSRVPLQPADRDPDRSFSTHVPRQPRPWLGLIIQGVPNYNSELSQVKTCISIPPLPEWNGKTPSISFASLSCHCLHLKKDSSLNIYPSDNNIHFNLHIYNNSILTQRQGYQKIVHHDCLQVHRTSRHLHRHYFFRAKRQPRRHSCRLREQTTFQFRLQLKLLSQKPGYEPTIITAQKQTSSIYYWQRSLPVDLT